MTERFIRGSGGVVTYDDDLVDYRSGAFLAGYEEGAVAREDVPKLLYSRPTEWNDAEWASYCEGFLMGWCERGEDAGREG